MATLTAGTLSMSTHPGEILLEEFLKPTGKTVSQFAKDRDVDLETLMCFIYLNEGTRRDKHACCAYREGKAKSRKRKEEKKNV